MYMTNKKIILANKTPMSDEIWKYSNPDEVFKKGKEADILIYRSFRPSKKYMVLSPDDKWIHFGQMDYQDYTKHKDDERRENFLNRSSQWKNLDDIYSPAFLSRYFLW